jgi:hypothetical protein
MSIFLSDAEALHKYLDDNPADPATRLALADLLLESNPPLAKAQRWMVRKGKCPGAYGERFFWGWYCHKKHPLFHCDLATELFRLLRGGGVPWSDVEYEVREYEVRRYESRQLAEADLAQALDRIELPAEYPDEPRSPGPFVELLGRKKDVVVPLGWLDPGFGWDVIFNHTCGVPRIAKRINDFWTNESLLDTVTQLRLDRKEYLYPDGSAAAFYVGQCPRCHRVYWGQGRELSALGER